MKKNLNYFIKERKSIIKNGVIYNRYTTKKHLCISERNAYNWLNVYLSKYTLLMESWEMNYHEVDIMVNSIKLENKKLTIKYTRASDLTEIKLEYYISLE